MVTLLMQEAMSSTPSYLAVADVLQDKSHYVIFAEKDDSCDLLALQTHLSIAKTKLFLFFNPDHSIADYLEQSEKFIQKQAAGTHIIICGTESFIWQVHAMLATHGYLEHEVSLVLDQTIGHPLKRVYCVHCSHIQDTSEQDYYECKQCSLHLFIRTHFSERLGAYMGVFEHVQHQNRGVAV